MVVKSEVDTNSYRSLKLKNGLEVILVSNPVLTKASFALSMKKGSFDDPGQHHGLCHFLEHMLFMGTEKYPGENDFMEFLNRHNGSSNAFTADEMTVYFCDIDLSVQNKLADMFSSFFTCPLFLEGAVTREISAVNSEYLNSLNKEGWRQQALLGAFLREGDARGKFGCGNAETLRQKDILETLKNFWRREYSCDKMKLAICSSSGFEEMEKMAQLFSDIKSGECSKEDAAICDSKNEFARFDPKYYRKIIQMAPLDDRKELMIIIDIPSVIPHFKKGALSFIDFVFTRPDSNSLISRLKEKGLAYTLAMDAECFSFSTRVRICAELTCLGCREYLTVLDLISAYLSGLRADEREFMRLKRVQQEEFSIMQPDEPLDLVVSLVDAMQHYPVENAINHEYVYEVFDSELISSLLGYLSDCDKWVIIISDNTGEFTLKEKYYNVEYKVIGEYSGRSTSEISCHDLPFNTSHLSSMDLIKQGERFLKKEDFGLGKIIYVFDEEFAVPRSEIFVRMKTKDFKGEFVNIRLYLTLIADAFNEKYARELFNYHISLNVSVSHDGAVVHFCGVSNKMREMCVQFFKELYSADNKRFELFKRQLEDYYTYEITKSPVDRLLSTLSDRINGFSSYEEIIAILKQLKKDDMSIPKWTEIDLLAVGNISYEDVRAIYEDGIENENISFNSSSVKRNVENFVSRDFNEAEGRYNSEFRTYDKFNNGLGMFYPMADLSGRENELKAFVDMEVDEVESRVGEVPSFKNIAIGRLIHQICSEDFFNQLRTNEELGYVVYSTVRAVGRKHFLSFIVQSEKSVEYLEERIIRFVRELKESIQNMDDETFKTHKNSLICWYEEPVLNLSALSTLVWNQSIRTAVDLNLNLKMAEIVENLEISDLLGSSMLDEYTKVNSFYKN